MAVTDPPNVPAIPSNDKLNWTWDKADEWVKRATDSQNQRYAVNQGRMFEVAENYDLIEAKILISAFGDVCFYLSFSSNNSNITTFFSQQAEGPWEFGLIISTENLKEKLR